VRVRRGGKLSGSLTYSYYAYSYKLTSRAANARPGATYLAEEEARAQEEATAAACRALWLSVKDAGEQTQTVVRAVIDDLMDNAENASDLAAVDAAEAERQAGAQPVPWEQVKAELGL
jgi:hypothetical protein